MGKFVVRQTATGYTWALKAGNGEIIAIGGEVFNTLAAAKNGCESVAKNAQNAGIEDQTVEGFESIKHPKFEIYTDKKGETRFRLKATNGQVIAASEGYTTKSACKNGIESVIKNSLDAPIDEIKE
ncbi:MAG: YegP family protein [Ruminococcus sp.]|nr:YegP family protein [Ruminococcus sp.]